MPNDGRQQHPVLGRIGPVVHVQFGLAAGGAWGEGWGLFELIDICEAAGAMGIELAPGGDHGVKPQMDAEARRDARTRFERSPVRLVGLATGLRVDHADADRAAEAAPRLRDHARLSHDVGGAGVTVKCGPLGGGEPGRVEQVAAVLKELGRFAAGWGQQVRVEPADEAEPDEGGGAADDAEPAADLLVVNRAVEAADHHNVAVAWPAEPNRPEAADADADALAERFDAVRDRLGEAVYIGDLEAGGYPYARLLWKLRDAEHRGWVLLRADPDPRSPADALTAQRRIFDQMVRG